MYVSYDPDARVTYVEWEAGPIATTIEVSDLMMVDVDEHRRPIGVEFVVSPTSITDEMLELLAERFPDLKPLREKDRWLRLPTR